MQTHMHSVHTLHTSTYICTINIFSYYTISIDFKACFVCTQLEILTKFWLTNFLLTSIVIHDIHMTCKWLCITYEWIEMIEILAMGYDIMNTQMVTTDDSMVQNCTVLLGSLGVAVY